MVQQRGVSGKRGPVIHRLSEGHQNIPAGEDESFAILRALEFSLENGYSRTKVRSAANALRKRLRRMHRDHVDETTPTRTRILELARQLAWVDFGYIARRKNQLARGLARAAWVGLEPASVERADKREESQLFWQGLVDGRFGAIRVRQPHTGRRRGFLGDPILMKARNRQKECGDGA